MASSTSRDKVLRFLLDVNRHGRQSHSPLRFGRAGRDRGELTAESPMVALAYETGITFSWVHEILTELQAKGWTDPGQPLRVLDPAAVFAWWRERRTDPKVHSFQVKDPKMLAHELASSGIPNAITTYYGENQYHGHLFPRRMDTYVRTEDLARARQATIEAGGQLGGTNFRLWTGDDDVVAEAQRPSPGPMNLQFAMVPQIILDLYHEGGSAAEAADIMIQKEYAHAKPRLR